MRSMLLVALLPLVALGQSSVRLQWEHDGVDVTSFRLYAGSVPEPGAMLPKVNVRGANSRSGQIDGLDSGVWYFAATAVNGIVESDPSNVVCVALGADFVCPLPRKPAPVTTLEVTAAPTGYRYLRWTITQRRGASNSTQVADLQLMLGADPVPWPAGSVATNPGGNNPENERATNVLDAISATKALDFNFSPSDSIEGLSVFVIDAAAPIAFDGYRWRTGNDAPERDPVSWTLELADDGGEFLLVDARADVAVPVERGAFTSTFRF